MQEQRWLRQKLVLYGGPQLGADGMETVPSKGTVRILCWGVAHLQIRRKKLCKFKSNPVIALHLQYQWRSLLSIEKF